MLKIIRRITWLAVGFGCGLNTYNGLGVILGAKNDFDLSMAFIELACMSVLLYTFGRCVDGVIG